MNIFREECEEIIQNSSSSVSSDTGGSKSKEEVGLHFEEMLGLRNLETISLGVAYNDKLD